MNVGHLRHEWSGTQKIIIIIIMDGVMAVLRMRYSCFTKEIIRMIKKYENYDDVNFITSYTHTYIHIYICIYIYIYIQRERERL